MLADIKDPKSSNPYRAMINRGKQANTERVCLAAGTAYFSGGWKGLLSKSPGVLVRLSEERGSEETNTHNDTLATALDAFRLSGIRVSEDGVDIKTQKFKQIIHIDRDTVEATPVTDIALSMRVLCDEALESAEQLDNQAWMPYETGCAAKAENIRKAVKRLDDKITTDATEVAKPRTIKTLVDAHNETCNEQESLSQVLSAGRRKGKAGKKQTSSRGDEVLTNTRQRIEAPEKFLNETSTLNTFINISKLCK